MKLRTTYLFSFLSAVAILFLINACALKGGYDALNELDYFRAKKRFNTSLKYHPEAASYGLSILYSRDKNPFHSLDSAYRYVVIADTSWNSLKESKKVKLGNNYNYTRASIDSMLQLVSDQFYAIALSENTVASYSKFLNMHPWSDDYAEALNIRDSMAFYQAMEENTAEAYQDFLDKYPDSPYALMAEDNYYDSHFIEATNEGSLDAYLKFMEDYPDSPMREEAEYKVYELVTKPNTAEAYELFILGYGDNRNVPKAWDEFFQIYLSDYSEERIKKFLEKYDYAPNKERIEQEMAWAGVTILPFLQDGEYGFASTDGKQMIVPQFEFAGPFIDGLAMVVKDEKYGFVDKLGRMQIPCEYESASEFHQGRSVVERDGKLGMIDRNNRLLLPFMYEDLGEVADERIYLSKGDKYGYADWNGTLVIPEKFDEAFDFSHKLAKVEADGFFGMVNPQGEYVIEPKYEDLTPLSDSLLICVENGRKGIITNNGTTVIQPMYDQIGGFYDGRALVSRSDTVEYVDATGEIVISKGYKTFPNFLFKGQFNEGTAIAYRKGKYGKINTYGKVTTDFEYDNIGAGSAYSPFRKEDSWGLMSAANKTVVSAMYQSLDLVEDTYVIARQNDSLGVLNVAGEILIPFGYSSIEYIGSGIFAVKDNGKLALFDKGQKVTEFAYDQIMVFDDEFVSLFKGKVVEYYSAKTHELIVIQRFKE